MGDSISVRQVLASTDLTDRIQKAEAVTNQTQNDEFHKELSRQEELDQARITKKDEADEVTIRDEEKKRREEERKRKELAKAAQEELELSEELEPETKHIIDLQI